MLKRCVPFVAILLAFAITASADAAQRQRRAKPEEPPPPPQFKVEVATRTIQMTQVKNSVPKGATVGKLLSGCTFRGAGGNSPIRSEDVFQDDRAEDYIREFANEASLAGYRLAGSQGGNLFDSADQRGAELLIGAVITSLKEESCWQEWTSPHMETEVTMGVEWQVFDPLEKKIVHRQSMDVSKTVKATEIAPVILALAARETFRAAAKNLVADPNFVAAVKDPKGGAPANSDSLFPEATSSAPAAAPTQIPRLALSGADFRAQVGTLRQQVVTILTPGAPVLAFTYRAIFCSPIITSSTATQT